MVFITHNLLIGLSKWVLKAAETKFLSTVFMKNLHIVSPATDFPRVHPQSEFAG